MLIQSLQFNFSWRVLVLGVTASNGCIITDLCSPNWWPGKPNNKMELNHEPPPDTTTTVQAGPLSLVEFHRDCALIGWIMMIMFCDETPPTRGISCLELCLYGIRERVSAKSGSNQSEHSLDGARPMRVSGLKSEMLEEVWSVTITVKDGPIRLVR